MWPYTGKSRSRFDTLLYRVWRQKPSYAFGTDDTCETVESSSTLWRVIKTFQSGGLILETIVTESHSMVIGHKRFAKEMKAKWPSTGLALFFRLLSHIEWSVGYVPFRASSTMPEISNHSADLIISSYLEKLICNLLSLYSELMRLSSFIETERLNVWQTLQTANQLRRINPDGDK